MEFYKKQKAARALLEWKQEDLAKRSGVSLPAIRSIELANNNPTMTTQQKILAAFEQKNVFFTPNGVEQRPVHSYTVNSYMALLEDICKELPDGGEILKHCVDDRRSSPEVIEKVKQMSNAKITERLTIADDNDFVTGIPEHYRQIPANYCANSEIIIIYGGKVAFFIDNQALIITSTTLSQVFTHQFEYWWKEGKKLDA